MGSYTVKPGESWASIAGKIYGNQRWLMELANVNGGINRILHPGDTIDAPDFDLSQTPVITNDQWAGVPTGMTGNNVNYGNAQPAVPSFGSPAVPTFTGGQKTTTPGGNRPGNVGDPFSGIPGQARSSNQTFGTSQRGQYNPLPQGTGYSGGSNLPTGDPFSGIPGQSRQQGSGRTYTSGSMSNGGSAANPKVQRPAGAGVSDPFSIIGRGIMTGVNALGSGLTNAAQQVAGAIPRIPGLPQMPTRPPYASTADARAQNSASGAPAGTPASDRAFFADAARWTSQAFYAYGGGYGDSYGGHQLKGNRSVLPTRVMARTAAFMTIPPEFGSVEEFMQALGYRIGPDGNWQLYNPTVTSGYTPQSGGYIPYTPSSGGGGGGGSSRGPAFQAQGYGPAGQLVQWRIGA